MLPVATTEYDLNFRAFGIPVRVHPLFWLMAVMMGFQPGNLRLTGVWVACVFVSILVHELGHAFASRSYGWSPHILLYVFGGLAFFQPTHGFTRRRSVWISFAGPLAGFVLFGIVFTLDVTVDSAVQAGQEWAVRLRTGRMGQTVVFTFQRLEYINLFWGLMNLLPVHPLDGGNICREVFDARSSIQGRSRMHIVGLVTGVAVAAYSLDIGQWYIGLLFGSLAYENYRQLTLIRRGF
ncbi:hypothetical protein GC176_04775 [bacterium]|nr:hypothetical protein [bacterium]